MLSTPHIPAKHDDRATTFSFWRTGTQTICTIMIAVFGSSAQAQFTTVINVPPDLAPTGIGPDTQLNLLDGGVLPSSFNAGSADGTSSNVEVNISSGLIGDGFDANRGSTTNIAGGSFGDGFDAFAGSRVNMSGGEFLLDGVPVSGLEIEGSSRDLNVPSLALFTGTLADGTPFAFSSREGDSFASEALGLTAVALPPAAPTLITASTDTLPLGIRRGQTLLVDNGGVVPANFTASFGSTVNVDDGAGVGDNFEAAGADVNISGGFVGDRLDALNGSRVNISGGSVGHVFDAHLGSSVEISGGSVGDLFTAQFGSSVTISGGSVGDGFNAHFGSSVTISGGSVGDFLRASGDNTVTIAGGAIGNSFEAFGAVTIIDGSVGDGFVANGGTVNIVRGTIGDRFRARRHSTVVFSGGSVGDDFDVSDDSTVAILGGTIGDRFMADNVIMSDGSVGSNFVTGGTATISGGVVGSEFVAAFGSNVAISGGEIGSGFDARLGGAVTISGGTIGEDFDAFSGSTIHLIGTEFSLNGMALEELRHPGDSLVVEMRDELLSGMLLDGSPIDFDLSSTNFAAQDFFDPNAGLILTLGLSNRPLCGDFDGDYDVDIADRTIQTINWTGALRPGDPNADKTHAEGDCNFDRDVDTADQIGWLQNATFGMAGNLEDGSNADFVYDPATGNVTLDASDTASGKILGFVFGTNEDNLRTENLVTGPFGAGPFINTGRNTDNTTFQIGQTDALNQGAGPQVNLGDVLPAGMTTAPELANYLSLAEYASDLGVGGTFDLFVVQHVAGDADSDGDVDAADRTILTTNWTGALLSGEGDRTFADGDFDFDGDVDTADVTSLLQNWTGALGQIQASVPEPSGPAMLAIALTVMLFCPAVKKRRLQSCIIA